MFRPVPPFRRDGADGRKRRRGGASAALLTPQRPPAPWWPASAMNISILHPDPHPPALDNGSRQPSLDADFPMKLSGEWRWWPPPGRRSFSDRQTRLIFPDTTKQSPLGGAVCWAASMVSQLRQMQRGALNPPRHGKSGPTPPPRRPRRLRPVCNQPWRAVTKRRRPARRQQRNQRGLESRTSTLHAAAPPRSGAAPPG